MPSFKIKLIEATAGSFANIKNINGQYIFSIDRFLCKTSFAKHILYHEFTHIYDDINLKDFEMNSFIKHVYSEYHASQIEMMAEFNITEAFDDNFYIIEYDTLLKDLLQQKSDFFKKSKTLKLSKIQDFIKAMDLFCYYIGKSFTFLSYIFEENVENIINLDEFEKVFGKDINTLSDALLKCNSNNITMDNLLNIAESHLPIVKKFEPK